MIPNSKESLINGTLLLLFKQILYVAKLFNHYKKWVEWIFDNTIYILIILFRWIQKWNDIENEFQYFFLEKIQSKEDIDSQSILSKKDLEFKNTYEKIVEESFKRMRTLEKSNQLKVYAGQLNNEGIVSPTEGNTAIRKQLHQEAIAMLDDLTGGLSDILWSSYNEIIKWINEKLWELPEIRKKMIGLDENSEKEKMKKCFDTLLKRLARPAIDIFLRLPFSYLYK